MTPFQRLVWRLEQDGYELPIMTLHRTYAGHWQRAAGAWSWWGADQLGREIIASQYRITDLLKAEAIEVGDDHYGNALVLYPKTV